MNEIDKLIEKVKKELDGIKEYNNNVTFLGQEVYEIIVDYLPNLEACKKQQEELIEIMFLFISKIKNYEQNHINHNGTCSGTFTKDELEKIKVVIKSITGKSLEES
jgi:hypothetical protein